MNIHDRTALCARIMTVSREEDEARDDVILRDLTHLITVMLLLACNGDPRKAAKTLNEWFVPLVEQRLSNADKEIHNAKGE